MLDSIVPRTQFLSRDNDKQDPFLPSHSPGFKAKLGAPKATMRRRRFILRMICEDEIWAWVRLAWVSLESLFHKTKFTFRVKKIAQFDIRDERRGVSKWDQNMNLNDVTVNSEKRHDNYVTITYFFAPLFHFHHHWKHRWRDMIGRNAGWPIGLLGRIVFKMERANSNPAHLYSYNIIKRSFNLDR